ncbi:unnamed protein product [Hermetia illucens]|uniref:Cyclin-dependent kinase 2-associated protein n=2 Tax=Hermetia illucens TaxID=343691 RepID=A0A7R8UUV9_HERIL|nr:unnamed protein product [Hermetia illucens]
MHIKAPMPQSQYQAMAQPQIQIQPQYQQLSHQPTSPVIVTTQTSANITTPMTSAANIPSLSNLQGLSKYAQLLAVIEEMGRDIRPTYTGSRSSTERLKRGIVHARILVRECLMETERSARQ